MVMKKANLNIFKQDIDACPLTTLSHIRIRLRKLKYFDEFVDEC